jgi:hypothetical protein
MKREVGYSGKTNNGNHSYGTSRLILAVALSYRSILSNHLLLLSFLKLFSCYSSITVSQHFFKPGFHFFNANAS